jgi:hypothetical protein
MAARGLGAFDPNGRCARGAMNPWRGRETPNRCRANARGMGVTMDWGALLAWIGAVASAVIILLLKAHLGARHEERQTNRTTQLDDRRRRIETDRDLYASRLTTLVRSNLATYIRSGAWWTDDADRERLLLGLEQGAYEDFVDPEVNAAWVRLLRRTLLLAKRRGAGTITPRDVEEYNVVLRAWEDAAKRSFGPLPDPEDLTPRRGERGDAA